MTRVAAIFTCLALAGCSAAPSQGLQTVDLGAEVTLAPGATFAVKSAGLSVRFVAVIEDSRCPRDVTCIWAGQVKIQLEILQSSQPLSRVEVLAGSSVAAGEYAVTLVRVEPEPVTGARIATQDYRATLMIDKAA